jgi:hypothetical protein
LAAKTDVRLAHQHSALQRWSGAGESLSQVVVMRCTSARFKSPDHEAAITMNFDLFDLAGLVGVLLIVIAYLLLQLDKLPSSSLTFSLLNAAGSLLIMVSLIFKFNASAFLIEVFWFLISLIGLMKWLISRKQPSRERNW